MSTRQEHWEHVYNTRNHQQVGWYQSSPDISLALLERIQAQPSHAVIDIGCGVSTLVDQLIAQDFRDVSLLDISAKALDTVKTRLADQADIPNYLNADISKATLNKSFDIWHDRAVFHFLSDTEDRTYYMETLSAHLSQEGHAIIGTFSVEGPNMCSGLEVIQYNDAKMEAELCGDLMIAQSLHNTHTTPTGIVQKYQFFIIKHQGV